MPPEIDLRRWLARFDAVASVEREEMRRIGPRPAWSVDLALSLIAAMQAANGGCLPSDPLRERETEQVRDTWMRLRRGLRR